MTGVNIGIQYLIILLLVPLVTVLAVNRKQQRTALAHFLKTRRAHISPGDVGLPPGVRRRTPGLRREEVAQLAEVGVTWYTWLEQGRDINVSEAVLTRIADALKLNRDERLHLLMLARSSFPMPPSPSSEPVSSVLQQLLDNQGINPTYLTGRRCDILAWNEAAAKVFGDFGSVPTEERNLIWLLFTNSEFRRRFVDWERYAQDLLAIFRAYSGRYMGDPWYVQFVTDLAEVNPEFEEWWQQHDVCSQFDQHRQITHPDVGGLSFEVITLYVNGDPDLRLCTYIGQSESDTIKKLHKLVATNFT